MAILQKKRRTTGKKALAYRGKGGQNTDIAFPALRLGVYLLTLGVRAELLLNGVGTRNSVLSAESFLRKMLRNSPEILGKSGGSQIGA